MSLQKKMRIMGFVSWVMPMIILLVATAWALNGYRNGESVSSITIGAGMILLVGSLYFSWRFKRMKAKL